MGTAKGTAWSIELFYFLAAALPGIRRALHKQLVKMVTLCIHTLEVGVQC